VRAATALTLAMLLGLSGSTNAGAEEPDPPGEETPEEEPAPALSDAERAELLGPYLEAIQAGRKAEAADALIALIDDPASGDLHGMAWLNLASVLKGLDLGHAALHAYARALELDPAGAAGEVSGIVDLAMEVGDDAVVAPALLAGMGAPLDTEARSKASYLSARYSLRTDELGDAIGVLYTVDKSSELYPEAKSLLGITLSQQSRHAEALPHLIEAAKLGYKANKGERFDNAARLNVARLYFATGNWGQAIYNYASVDRESPFWPEANFERAWTHFRADDMTGTLAQLMNHRSPFFEEWYFAEADLLRAYALFMMCKFTDASTAIDDFVNTYTPMQTAIAGHMSSIDPAGAFADARSNREGDSARLPRAVLRPFETEDRFGEAMAAVDRADAELARLPSLSTYTVGQRATEWTTARKAALIELHGQRVIDRATHVKTELDGMLEGIEITRLDLLNLEASMYERAANTGELEYGDKIGKLRSMRKNQRGSLVWPFQGEYWADEIGWYQIDARPDCPTSMAKGEKKGGSKP
jgi:tetratricopeptide (TPR) repeat protein